MGNLFSSIFSKPRSHDNTACRASKRKRSEDDVGYESESETGYGISTTKKRRKIGCTSEYLYENLFKKGQGSDITVNMMNKAWKLHKLFICQSPYFESMFNGSWIETDKKVIDIEITDPNITVKSLTVVLGMYYSHDVTLEPTEVIANLATAMFFLHQNLIGECTQIMIETMNSLTAVSYLEAATKYGLTLVQKAAKTWLKVNITNLKNYQASLLRSINTDLMTELVQSPDLVALQTEFGIYTMLKYWIFVKMNAEVKNNFEGIEAFYENHTWKEPFLLTADGLQFAAPFRSLRHKHLVLLKDDIDVIRSDLLIPQRWLDDSYRQQWLHTLRINVGEDQGPMSISENKFAKECFRWGRYIEAPEEHVWRWKGFYYGLELVVSVTKNNVTICRNNSHRTHCIEDNNEKHNVMLKAHLISLNKQGQIEHLQTSGIQEFTLYKNENKKIMTIDKDLKYPLLISFNVLMITPFTDL